ncbi:hypothetical protein TNCT_569511, partial [Trichonephila clavata]
LPIHSPKVALRGGPRMTPCRSPEPALVSASWKAHRRRQIELLNSSEDDTHSIESSLM